MDARDFLLFYPKSLISVMIIIAFIFETDDKKKVLLAHNCLMGDLG